MRKLFSFAVVVTLICGLFTACEGEKTDAKKLEGRWTISEVTGDKVTTERPAFMEFNMQEMRLHGNAGCNTFNSGITLDPKDVSKIKLNQAVTTMMACPDMDTENKILKAIESVDEVKTNKKANEMLLTDKVGKVLFVLTKN
ncbi:MAG: META domain-containing protein [Tannerellaceae bacterium]|nr:META domain-containing protein [Tannerellaceae bacterium]